MNAIESGNRRGLMLVLSSPSGAGKTSLARKLLDSDDEITMSISATTREKRPGEEHGKDYYFVEHDRFREMVSNDELLEHAVVFGNFYGTPRGPVMAGLQSGRDVLFDIDWQGTQQLTEGVRDDLVRVFILPPSIRALEERLRKRAQDSERTVQSRMAEAMNEITHWDAYDYVLVNDDFDETFECLKAILQAERLKRRRQFGLSKFVGELRREHESTQ